MSYKEFLEWIETQLKIRMGEEARIHIHSVTKNNEIVLDGLSILEKGDNVSPAIYLNSFYQEYLAGERIEHILGEIISCYQKGKKIRRMDMSFYTNGERAKQRIVCRLVNWEKNKKLLSEIPHRPFLDLAVVYYYLLEQKEIGSAAILVRNEHLEMWNMKEEVLHEMAMENMQRLLPWKFISMEELMRALMKEQCWMFKEEDAPLYVLSNSERSYGAAWIVDYGVLEQIGEKLEDDYYILPSSIHECMIVPLGAKVSAITLLEMVIEMNQTQVEPEEVLADTIYLYHRKEKRIKSIALGGKTTWKRTEE